MKIVKYIIAREEHEDGSHHIHAYVCVDGTLNIKDPRAFDITSAPGTDLEAYHGNYQSCRSINNVVRYVTKEDNYITNIDKEIQEIKSRKSRQEDAAKVLNGELPLLQYLKDHPSLHLLAQYQRIKAALLAVKSDQRPTINRPQVCGKWIVGTPHTGKSFAARFGIKPEESPYIKDQTKWWDNYSGQSVVILDDLSPPSKNSALSIQDLAYYLKIWTDRYEIHGEIKGGQGGVRLSYKTFVVTSNYTIEQIFGNDDSDLLAALNRRFVIIGLTGIQEVSEVTYPDQYELSNTQKEFEIYLKWRENVKQDNEEQVSIDKTHPPQNPKDDS